MKLSSITNFFIFLTATALPALAVPNNVLPKEAIRALHAPKQVTLYSLEPLQQPTVGDKSFHNFKILGLSRLDSSKSQIACKAFEKAVNTWPGMTANCFDPRLALRIIANGHIFDFLLCYQCDALDVYKDNKPIASLGAGGSPATLNRLLSFAGVPLAKPD